MNAHLYLTKYGSEDESSLLMNAIKSGEKKTSFYSNLIREFQAYWKGASVKPDLSWYKLRFEQHYSDLPTENISTRILHLQTISPLLIGNGTTSVLESHVALHRIYGIPYIPGTALKGIAAHFSHRVVGQQHKQFQIGEEVYNTLFGTTKQRGYITFYDALPEPDCVGDSLMLDVMTPHHKEYNKIKVNRQQQEGTKEGRAPAPRDDDSPEPITFLSVNAKFRLILACEGNDEASQEWLTLACKLVKQAIQSEGVGGKTNAGYGRFEVTEDGARKDK